MRRLLSLLLLLLVLLSPVVYAGNTHGNPDPLREMGAWFGDNGQPFLVSACAPSVPTTSLTLGAFACSGYVLNSTGSWTYITQAASVVGPLNAGNGTYWVALQADLSTAVAGWTRQTGTHYLWQKAATLPSTPVRTIIVAEITVAGGIITATAPVSSKDPARYPRGLDVSGLPGIDLTGATDSTQAFQRAVNTARHLWLPNGTYLLGRITPVTGTIIECEGWGAILKQKAGLNADLIRNEYTDPVVNNLTIKNCQIDGNKANNSAGSAIQVNGVNILIEHNYIHDTANACVVLGRPAGAKAMRILDNWCDNPSNTGLFWGAFAFTGGADLLMRGNIATTSDGFMAYGYDIEPNNGWAMSNVLVQDNIAVGGNLVADATSGGTITNLTVQGNYIDETNAAGGPSGLRFFSVGGVLLVTGNTVIANSTTLGGIDVRTATRPILTNNHITYRGSTSAHAQMAGIYFESVVEPYVSNNHIIANVSNNIIPCISGTTSAAVYGLNATAGCTPYASDSETRVFALQNLRRRPLTFHTSPLMDTVGAGSVQNLITNSQVFSAAWVLNSTMAVVDNNATDPLGQANLASTATAGAGGNPYLSRGIAQATASGEYWVSSVWMASSAGTLTIPMRLAGNASGTMGSQTFSVGTGWNRYWVSGGASGVDATLTTYINENGAGNTFYLWGAQLERGDSPGPYLRTYGTATTLTSALSVNNMLVMGNTIAADLPTVMNGALMYCSDCAVTGVGDNTCAGGGTGALAFRINAVWRCFNAQN